MARHSTVLRLKKCKIRVQGSRQLKIGYCPTVTVCTRATKGRICMYVYVYNIIRHIIELLRGRGRNIIQLIRGTGIMQAN